MPNEDEVEVEFNPMDISDDHIDMTEANDLLGDEDEMTGFHDVEEETL